MSVPCAVFSWNSPKKGYLPGARGPRNTGTLDFPGTTFSRLSAWLSNSSAVKSRLSTRSEEHTSELQSHHDLVCRLLLEKKKNQGETHEQHLPALGQRNI